MFKKWEGWAEKRGLPINNNEYKLILFLSFDCIRTAFYWDATFSLM